MKRKIGLFEASVVLFFYILPVLSIAVSVLVLKETGLPKVILKWSVFWGVGFRLFTCGLKQAVSPSFTATEIFKLTDEKALPIVRELGFANICTGLMGILSLFVSDFRFAAAVTGGLYYFLALLLHLTRKNKNSAEVFVTVTDLSIVLELAVPLFLILLNP